MFTSPGALFAANARRWFMILCAGLGMCAGQIVNLHVFQHGRLSKKSADIVSRQWEIQAERGSLLDRNGVVLAYTTTAQSLYADPHMIKAPRATARALAPVLHCGAGDLEARLRRPGRFVWLRRCLDDATVKKVQALKLTGIGTVAERKRAYPYGSLAAHTLGFVNREHKGGAGLECFLEPYLAGKNGYVVAEVDGGKRVIPGRRAVERPPERGRDVILTLDINIQKAAELALASAVDRWKAAGGTVIVMNPRDGAILALACLPAFDPARYNQYPKQRWAHPAISYIYEPGSTFKLVAACAALEERVVSLGETVVCCAGSAPVGNRVIHCAVHGKGGHGRLDLPGVIIKSCNLGAARLAARVGPEKMARCMRLLGFGQKTEIGLGGEAAGWFPDPRKWKPIVTANIAFGQSVAVTPLQLLAAYCAVANGGVLPRPHLVKRVAASAKEPGRTFTYQGRRAMSEATAATLRRILRRVVLEGTGKPVALAHYSVAGKTGTAQKPTREAGFKSGKYVASFVGFVPVEDPAVAILVTIDEPKGAHYGAVVAAPVFREVAAYTVTYMAVPPSPQPMTRTAQGKSPGGA